MITAEEFKALFGLDPGCKVLKSTLKRYTRYIEGSYLMYNELLQIDEVEFRTILEGKRVHIGCWLAESKRWWNYQDFIYSLGNDPYVEMKYIDGDFSEPFWSANTVTKLKEDLGPIYKAAYVHFKHRVLDKIASKYRMRFNIDLNVRKQYLAGHKMYKMQGPEFLLSLEYTDENKRFKTLNSYDIKKSIFVGKNIWKGPLPRPVLRVIKDAHERNRKKLYKAYTSEGMGLSLHVERPKDRCWAENYL